jgi:hypothetical protein
MTAASVSVDRSSTVLTVLRQPRGYCICITGFNIQIIYVLPTHLCVLYVYDNKQRLFLYAALTKLLYNRDGVCLLRGAN